MKFKLTLLFVFLTFLKAFPSAVPSGDEYFPNAIGEYVVQDGIYYRIDVPEAYLPSISYFRNIICQYDKICYVVAHPAGYSGDLVIPDQVEYNNQVFTVVGVMPTEIEVWYQSYSQQIGAFENCENLTSIHFPSTLVRGASFTGCSSLETIEFPDDMEPLSRSAISETAWYLNQPKGNIYLGKCYLGYKGGIQDPSEIVIKEGTVSIGKSACSGMQGLKKITLPNSLKYIGEFGLNNTGIASVELPNSLKVLYEYSISSDRLTSLTLPESVEEIKDFALYDATKLKSITFPNKYFKCSYFSFPYSWYETKPEGHIIIGDGIYLGYKGNLRNGVIFEVPEDVKYIASDTFRSESGLTSYANISELILPNNLIGIEKCAFYGLNINGLSIPEGIETLNWAISSCTIKSLELPASLKKVDILFYNNRNFCKNIFCKAENVPNVKNELFDSKWDPNVYKSCTLHVPAQSLEAYRNDEHWGKFENIVGDISSIDTIFDDENEEEFRLYDMNGLLLHTGPLNVIKEKFNKKGMFIIQSKRQSKLVHYCPVKI